CPAFIAPPHLRLCNKSEVKTPVFHQVIDLECANHEIRFSASVSYRPQFHGKRVLLITCGGYQRTLIRRMRARLFTGTGSKSIRIVAATTWRSAPHILCKGLSAACSAAAHGYDWLEPQAGPRLPAAASVIEFKIGLKGGNACAISTPWFASAM